MPEARASKSCQESAPSSLPGQWMGSAASLHNGDAVTVWYNGVPVRGTVTSAAPFVQVSWQEPLSEVFYDQERGGRPIVLTPLDRWLHGWYAESDYEVAKRTAPLTTTIERLRRGPHHENFLLPEETARAQESLLVQPHVRRALQPTRTHAASNAHPLARGRMPSGPREDARSRRERLRRRSKAADSTAYVYRLCLPCRRLRCRSSQRCPCPPVVRGGRWPPLSLVAAVVAKVCGSPSTCGFTRWQGVSSK